ncbi:MAG: hypothetical protein MI924_17175, partial [Chloroflexales bacterium]|nr:hypothetical protein [Chloroflexales bacterium]
TNPFVPSGTATFLFVNSYTYNSSLARYHFVQTGLTKQSACGSKMVAVAEWTDYNTGNPNYNTTCFSSYTVDGQNSAYNETNNASSPYWCNGINGNNCLLGGISESSLGMTNASYVASYSETTHTTAEMGAKSPNRAYIRQVSYKATRSGQINNPVSAESTTDYGGCGASPCPYNQVYGDETISGTNFLYVGLQTN